MTQNKTSLNKKSVIDFLNNIPQKQRRIDCLILNQALKSITRLEGEMWGDSIIGFDKYHYKYASGREGDIMMVGFSPRKQSITIYVMNGFSEYADELTRLGKHKISKSCLYVNKLADVNTNVLIEILKKSVQTMRKKYP